MGFFLILYVVLGLIFVLWLIIDIIRNGRIFLVVIRRLNGFEKRSLLLAAYLYLGYGILLFHQQSEHWIGKTTMPIIQNLANMMAVVGGIPFFRSLYKVSCLLKKIQAVQR
jgi:hypothetical protein